MATAREFQVLTDIEHVLTRPGMYLGQTSLVEKEEWIFSKETNRFTFGKRAVVPALLKCVSELVDNSIDVAIDTDFKAANKIKVNVTEKSIEVIDNGIGIPCTPPASMKDEKDPTKTCACLAWTTLKSGTSFGSDREKIGTNGVGASCVAVFSKVFIGKSDDGKKKQTITCKNNLSEIDASRVSKSSGESGCSVYCEPDLARFSLDKIDENHIAAVYQRLVTLSLCYPKIQFIFNGKPIKISGKKIGELFSDNSIVEVSDNTMVCVFPNDYDEFKAYSSVNGIITFRGGTHVEFVSWELCSRIRDKLVKKYKTLRPGDVKNRICMALVLTGFKNAEYDSQTKESLANATAQVREHMNGKIDFDKMAAAILKTPAIIDPIVETFKIKEELKARQSLKTSKRVKVRSEKYFPGIGDKKYLFLCEGMSAAGGLMKCLGRDGKYYYALRGLALNVYDSTTQKISANQEVKDVINILGLDVSKDKSEKQEIDFERIVIASDQDADGVHISAMLLGWWKKMAPSLFNDGKVCRLNTPIVILKDKAGKIKDWFFEFSKFKEWEGKNKNTNLNIVYLKGLGSLSIEDLDYIISKQGFESLLSVYKLDEGADKLFDIWLGSDAEARKNELKAYSMDINQI